MVLATSAVGTSPGGRKEPAKLGAVSVGVGGAARWDWVWSDGTPVTVSSPVLRGMITLYTYS